MSKKSIILALLCCFGCQMSSSSNNISVDEFFDNFGDTMKKEYNLVNLGSKIVCDGSLKKISLDYYQKGDANVLRARLLIHKTVEELIGSLNGVMRLNKNMKNNLTINDLEVSILFTEHRTHNMDSEKHISHVTLVKGTVCYFAHDEETKENNVILQENYS